MTNDFTYKPTTATWKILNLLKSKEGLYILQGGQGAGKTISTLMLIADSLQTTKKEITICSAESSKLSDTALRDFVKILKDWNIYDNFKHNSSENTFIHKHTGSYCEFIGLDKKDIGKGRRRDIVYINEANKIQLKQYTDISARAKMVILDYNPDAYFWAHDLTTKTNFINLTYKDNEYLSIEEVRNIENYYKLGYNDDGTVKNEYWSNIWKIYGLGEVGSVEGRIFNHFKKIPLSKFYEYEVPEIYIVDWGIVDPMAMLKCKFIQSENKIIAHELNYKSENDIIKEMSQPQLEMIKSKEGGIILYIFNLLQIPKTAIVICDSAGKDNIDILQRNGYINAIGVVKSKDSIMTGIRLIQSMNIDYTEVSTNLMIEEQNYSWAKDRLGFINELAIDDFNHLIDCLRYFALHLKRIGLINSY